MRNNISLDFNHFRESACQQKMVEKEQMDKVQFIELLKRKVESTDMDMVKTDVSPFLGNQQALEIWSTAYFLQLADMIRFE